LTRPVIVLSRHAGPGDSLLLVHQLLSVYQRRPRVVMKASLQFDPSVDIVGNRLPNVWIKSRQAGEHIFTEQIARLARGLDGRGALVIFPEGGNWTPGRWRRGIRRLESAGRTDLAERARDMPNLLPPRPGGALAAIAACPDADVIFVAHAGLDNIITVGDVWGKFPIDQVIRARWWRVASDSIPRSADYEAQVQWLYAWWERIDAWITAGVRSRHGVSIGQRAAAGGRAHSLHLPDRGHRPPRPRRPGDPPPADPGGYRAAPGDRARRARGRAGSGGGHGAGRGSGPACRGGGASRRSQPASPRGGAGRRSGPARRGASAGRRSQPDRPRGGASRGSRPESQEEGAGRPRCSAGGCAADGRR